MPSSIEGPEGGDDKDFQGGLVIEQEGPEEGDLVQVELATAGGIGGDLLSRTE